MAQIVIQAATNRKCEKSPRHIHGGVFMHNNADMRKDMQNMYRIDNS